MWWPTFEIVHFRTRFANERGHLGTRSSRYLWKCDKICRARLSVGGEVISGFSRRTRRDKVPTSTVSTPSNFEDNSHIRTYKSWRTRHCSCQGVATLQILVLQLRDRKWPSSAYRNKRFTIPRRGACSTRRAICEVAQLRAARATWAGSTFVSAWAKLRDGMRGRKFASNGMRQGATKHRTGVLDLKGSSVNPRSRAGFAPPPTLVVSS